MSDRHWTEGPAACGGKVLFELLLRAAWEDVYRKNYAIKEHLGLPETSTEKQYDITAHRQKIGFTVYNRGDESEDFVHFVLPDADGDTLEVIKIHDRQQKVAVKAVLSPDGKCVPELDGKQVKCEELTRLALEAMFRKGV